LHLLRGIRSERRLPVKGKSVSEVYRKDMRFKLENPYGAREKYPSNTLCPDCSAVFLKGNWRWGHPEDQAEVQSKLCPACRQIRDGYAGGVLILGGGFLAEHRDDILNRVRNVEAQVKGEHPLQRIMSIEERPDEIEIWTTSEHLAARLGKALKSDFAGELELSFADEDKFVRARWRRES
jgi:hypothetical protein